MRLRELAASRVRVGYRRLMVLLRRVNAKRIYRLYIEEALTVWTKHCTKAACWHRVPQARGHSTEPAVEYGLHEYEGGRLPVVQRCGALHPITVGNASEFASQVMDAWADRHGIHLDFIRPGKPVANCLIESFNGRLRDECPNVEVFLTLKDMSEKLSCWQEDYNFMWPHSSLQEQAPTTFCGGLGSDRTDRPRIP